MVNSKVLILVGILVTSSVSVGVVIGLYFGSKPGLQEIPGDIGGPSADADSEATPTPLPTTPEPKATSTQASGDDPQEMAQRGKAASKESQPTPLPPLEAADGEETPTRKTLRPAKQTPQDPSTFSENRIGKYVVQYVNRERTDEDYKPLRRTGSTADALDQMATDHSQDMAYRRNLTHAIYGKTSADRYRNHDLYGVCQPLRADDSRMTAADNGLEVISKTYVGQVYTANGTKQYNRDEVATAQAIVRDWLDDDDTREKLMIANARITGVGVEVEDDGAVYATMNLC
jgi:uncharacterized protein YkwD